MVTCTDLGCIDWWYVCYCNEQCFDNQSSTQIWYRELMYCCDDGNCRYEIWWVYPEWCYADLCSPCQSLRYGGDCSV